MFDQSFQKTSVLQLLKKVLWQYQRIFRGFISGEIGSFYGSLKLPH